jgi:hypothetical protein
MEFSILSIQKNVSFASVRGKTKHLLDYMRVIIIFAAIQMQHAVITGLLSEWSGFEEC